MSSLTLAARHGNLVSDHSLTHGRDVPQTQAERRATSRRALLDAATAVLVEDGLAATTTSEIARRADRSHGALFRHFPTKADLLVAVVEDVYPRLVAAYVEALGDRISAARERAAGLDVTADLLVPLLAAMRRPEARAGLELLTAARTDDVLADRIGRMEARHRAAMRDAGRPLLRAVAGPEVTDEALDAVVDVAVDLTVGIALTTAVADGDRVADELALAGRLLQPLLAPDHRTD